MEDILLISSFKRPQQFVNCLDFKELEQDKSNPDFSNDDPFYNVNQSNIQDCIKKYNRRVAELQKTIDETYTLFIDTLRKAVEEYEDSKTI